MRLFPILFLLAACGPNLPPSELRETDVDFADAGSPGSGVIDISGSQCPAPGFIRCASGSGGPLERCKASLGKNYWTINGEICP